jgi:tRNA(adenine34) deaminase
MIPHEKWMELALIEAQKAYDKKEVPVGAIVVENNKIIGRGYNLIEHLQDPSAHAELIAITAAANTLASWRLDECVLYTTLEPCPMCAGAIMLSRISTVVFATSDPRWGACGTRTNLLNHAGLNTNIEVLQGICEFESRELIQKFFRELRETKNVV